MRQAHDQRGRLARSPRGPFTVRHAAFRWALTAPWFLPRQGRSPAMHKPRRPSREHPPARRRRSLRTATALTAATVGLTLAVAGAAVGAPTAASASAPHSSSSVLRVWADTSFSTFNPFLAYFQADLNVLGNIYPTLTTIKENGQPAPYLATSWSVSPDKLTWTFTIRSGLKWSDGVPITARDAAWTFNLIMHNSVAGTANGALVANFASVTAPSATTLVITTKKPEANMLYVSNPITGIPIVPEHIWAKDVPHLGSFKNMNFPVVGYGPWIATGYVPNQYATLTANKNFYMGAPKYKTLIIQYFTNGDAAVAALRSGQLDEIDNLTATQYEALKSDKNITLYPSVSNAWTAVELNPGARTQSGQRFGNGSPALLDPRVREAIELAINKQELVSKVWDGLAVAGSGYLPPAYPQWQWTPPASEQLTYDPAKANQILTAAGYKMGSNGVRIDPKTHQPLVLRLGIHSDEPADAEMAPYLQEWLKAIGIQLNVQSMSFTQLNTELPKGDWDILSDTWATGPDPTYLLSIQTCGDLPTNSTSTGNTDAFFCNPAYDKLYDQQSTEFSPAQRAQTIDQMQQILYQNAVDVILYYPDNLGAVRSSAVKDFFYGKPGAHGFYPQQNMFINWRTANAATADSPSSSSPALWIVIAIVVVALLAGAVLVIRRRATAAERE
jgi:peptide/nickel transport system substrate-binding protein